MRTYLLSLTSNVDGVESNYLRTINKVRKSIIPIMVAFDPIPFAMNLDMIPKKEPYPNNLRRFDYFPEDFNKDDMIIFTDASDVIFQNEIPYLEPYKIYVSSENDVWGADNWWKDKLNMFNFHELDGTPIYCMGTWAMEYRMVKDLLRFIQQKKQLFNNAPYCDQILFNWWLKDKKITENKELFGTLYNNFEKGDILKTEQGFINKEGQLISIIHANGSTKELLVNKKT